MSAGDYLNLRIGRASLLDNLTGFERFWNCDNQESSARWICGSQNVGTRGIASDRFNVALFKLGKGSVRNVNSNERLAPLLERISDDAPNPTIADKNGMVR